MLGSKTVDLELLGSSLTRAARYVDPCVARRAGIDACYFTR